ncbi:unnamed protein product [Linum trigynum]|uniref:Harbinger transposase-derived protein n=1 Tax=Linum trigynum TaxID=586398 RepID=A0AAV2CGC0_9ROSI
MDSPNREDYEMEIEADERQREADNRQWEYECQIERDRMEMFMMYANHPHQHQASGSRGSSSTRKTVKLNKEDGQRRLMQDYFTPNPTYDAKAFTRRYRMPPALFNRVMNDVVQYDDYFKQGTNAAGRDSFSPHQKLTAAFRMLAYGCSADSLDESCRMAESTVLLCLRKFCSAITNIYGAQYLRAPTVDDTRHLLHHAAQRGFPGMIGSIDCMHWEWKNCPTGWAGQFTGHKKKPTIVLEAVASYDTWIWHAFFGTPGSNNDINTLGVSPLFDHAVQGLVPKVSYVVNGKMYDQCYYLADGIYPEWAPFVRTISTPSNQKKKLFARCQEAYRKDVERAFGILQQRWAIVRGPSRLWDVQTLGNIMLTCIIMHNMIVEDQRFEYGDGEEVNIEYENESNPNVTWEPPEHNTPTLMEYMARHNMIRDRLGHHALQNDLIEHLWTIHGGE